MYELIQIWWIPLINKLNVWYKRNALHDLFSPWYSRLRAVYIKFAKWIDADISISELKVRFGLYLKYKINFYLLIVLLLRYPPLSPDNLLKWDQDSWIIPGPFVSGCMTMPKLGSLSSLKAGNHLHLMIKTIKGWVCNMLCKGSWDIMASMPL